MTLSVSETCTEFRKAMGFKGRLLLFALGFIGLLFPGWVAYVALVGIAECTKNQNLLELLEQLAD